MIGGKTILEVLAAFLIIGIVAFCFWQPSEAVNTIGPLFILGMLVWVSIRLWLYVTELHWHDAFWALLEGGDHCWTCECDSDDWDDDAPRATTAEYPNTEYVVQAPYTFMGKEMTPEQVDRVLRKSAREIVTNDSPIITTGDPARFKRAQLVPDSAVFSDDKVQLPEEKQQLSPLIDRILDNLQYNAAMKIKGENALQTQPVYKGDTDEQYKADSKE